MSDLIIKIGDESLDLKSGEVIAITKQAAKVGDFSRVLSDGTNETTIPLTANNKTILENAHLLQTESEKPYRRLPATVIQEGYETLQDGFAIVQSSSDNFSLQVVAGNATFFNLIKDLNLRDLDLSAYDHFWTNANVFANRNNTSGFVYALFEQSDQSAGTFSTYGVNLYAVRTNLLLPCFFVHTLIEKIFAEQGYLFVSDITSLDIYSNAIVFAASTPNRGKHMQHHNATIRNEADILIDNLGARYNFEVASVDAPTTVYTASADFLAFLQLAQDSKFILTDSCNVTVEFTFILENTETDPSIQVTGQAGVLYTTSAGVQTIYSDTFSIPNNSTTTHTVSVTFDCAFFDNDIYFRSVLVCNQVNIVTIKEDSTFTVTANSLITNEQVTTNFPYNFFTGALPIPDMLQGEFLKDFAKIFQLIYDVDEVTHTVTARRFDEIKNNIPNAIDFSDKLAENKPQDIDFRIPGYAQKNYLKWKEDDITKYTAQGEIDVDDQTLEAEKVVIEMAQFAATSPVTRLDTKQVPYVPLFNIDQLPTNGMTDRMLLVRRETFAYNINFNRSTETPTDYPTDDVTFAYFAEAGNEDSLDFPTLITRFYQAINDMLFRAKSITCYVNLKIKDVVNYNPFIPVYFAKWNNYFYWEKLSNYVKGKLTQIKIIKL